MNQILRLILTLSSVSFFVIVYLLQNEIHLFQCDCWIEYLVYIITPLILSGISLILCRKLSTSSINKVISIETSNNDFLANYLAFFFVALSVNKDNMPVFWIVFGMIVIFTFVSRVSYFNPIFLIFGFNFYYVHTDENTKVMIISRNKYKDPNAFKSTNAKRINDYTFIEI